MVLGAGSFGSSIAELLSRKDDKLVTVVDSDADKLTQLRPRIDARFIAGNAETPKVLEKAGCEDADAILAVTSDDAINLTACHICKTMYGEKGTTARIARIRNHEISGDGKILDAFGITEAYNPEELISTAVADVVEFLCARKVIRFWGGMTNLLQVMVKKGDPLVGTAPSHWESEDPELSFRVVAVSRGGVPMAVNGDTVIQGGDDLMVATRSTDFVAAVNKRRGDAKVALRKVLVAGGGTIGHAIAKRLEEDYFVTLIEPDEAKCSQLVQTLGSTLVNAGDPSDPTMLRSEDVEHATYFCAVTDLDEINIMSALQAKQLGCDRTAVLINRDAYQQVLLKHEIDTVISPSEITVGILLRAINERKRSSFHAVNEGQSQIVEFTVQEGSEIAGTPFDEVPWPDNIIPCALGKAPITHHVPPILSGMGGLVERDDRVIVYVTDGQGSTLNKLVDLPFYV